jgi:hypothetical protein
MIVSFPSLQNDVWDLNTRILRPICHIEKNRGKELVFISATALEGIRGAISSPVVSCTNVRTLVL